MTGQPYYPPQTFWKLIQDSLGDPNRLKPLLEALPDAEVQDFERQYYACLIALNRWDVWGAGYVAADGMSDDSFHYFRSWIIGKGEAVYSTALTDPDALGPYLQSEDPESETFLNNEELEYVALEVLEARGIEDDPRDDLDATADDEPAGTAWDDDSVYERFPAIAELFSEA
jgi:hypothetical protein